MRIGSIVTYRTFDDSVRTVKITVLDEHNGRPAFTGVLLDEEQMPVRNERDNYRPVEVWGYRSQAFAVIY